MLIKCPECGKEISSNSDKCVGCGYPMAKKTNTVNLEIENTKKNKKEKLRIVLGILIFVCMFIMQINTGFALPIYYCIAGLTILILRKKNIGSIISLIFLLIGTGCFVVYENYNSIIGGMCCLLVIGVLVSVFIKENN